jgi:FKBP-type peptidyl-prolyl cis-trans isomerase (trigger factor)
MLEAQGMKLEDMGQSMGQLFEQYKTPAERQVRSTLLLGAIADREGLVAEDKDFDTKYQEFAEQMGQDVAAVKAKIDPEMLSPLILEKKALEFIISKAKITEK